MGTEWKEKTAHLWNELIEYEKNTEMTEEEQKALREWVQAGNSVHDNSSMACTGSGEPSDFLDVYRYEEEIRRDLEKLSPREQTNYLARLRGEDTMDNLREDLNSLQFQTSIYEQVLRENGLFNAAKLKIKQAKKEAEESARQFKEWRSAHPEEELPFD